MSRKYKFKDQNQHYFVKLTVTKWIDIFVRNEYKDILLDALKYCQKNKGLEIYSYCIITSHVHMIIGTVGDQFSDILKSLKKFTARKIKQEIGDNPRESRKKWLLRLLKNERTNKFQLWHPESHPIELNNATIMEQKLAYIHKNPIVAGFVDKAEDWIYSSAETYYHNRKGFLEIKLAT